MTELRTMVESLLIHLIFLLLIGSSAEELTTIELSPWPPSASERATVQDLHREYGNIFRFGNRNAASHRWSTFLLDRSDQMTYERLGMFFSGFCAVSGSPVRPSDYNRYWLELPKVGTGERAAGYMHYCCWPCVCDTQDFIRIDTLNVTTRDGGSQQRNFAVIGNPCDHPEKLNAPFYQPFHGGRTTMLTETAQEVRCLEDGTMEGATLSDHGYVIITMFFDAEAVDDADDDVDQGGRVLVAGGQEDNALIASEKRPPPQAGRITTAAQRDGSKVMFQDEREWGPHCNDRAKKGYNSGMGEIFRRVSSISPIPPEALAIPTTLPRHGSFCAAIDPNTAASTT